MTMNEVMVKGYVLLVATCIKMSNSSRVQHMVLVLNNWSEMREAKQFIFHTIENNIMRIVIRKGEISVIKCHINVNKMPLTGLMQVQGDSQCHNVNVIFIYAYLQTS